MRFGGSGSPEEFAREMRIAAAIQWYHQRLISQSKAAAIAGLNRRDFLTALYNAKVEASQVDIDAMKEDVERDLKSRRERLASDLLDQSGACSKCCGSWVSQSWCLTWFFPKLAT